MSSTGSMPSMLMEKSPHTRVVGILNVTADSFSDGGQYLDVQQAVAHGCALAAAGADVVDVGGESTRPGAQRVSAELEADRIVPVVRGLVDQGVVVSVDTMRSSVASAGIDAGASIINDVSGGRADPEMAAVVAAARVPWILMHWRPTGDSHVFAHRVDDVGGYRDVIAEVSAELLSQVDAAIDAGVDPESIILDPGLGFAKAAEHNWALLHALPTLVDLGFPVLIGASRKRFLGALLADDGLDRPPAGRDVATAAVSALSAAHGVWGVRVHDVTASRDAVAVASAWAHGGRRGRTDG